MPTQIIPAAPAPFNPNEVPPPAITAGIDPNTPPPTNVREGQPDGIPEDDFRSVNPQQIPLSGEWTTEQARKIVVADFDRAASYRQSNHETRWQRAAESYLAYSARPKVWEGTKTPRANIPVYLCFQQVEALIPQIVEALTGNDLDFDVEASRAGTTISQCHLVRDLMNYQLRSLGGTHTRFLGWREIIRRQAKDGLIYGNGVNEWGWEGPYEADQLKWETVNFPEMASVMHPAGFPMEIPTGRMLSQNMPVPSKKIVSQFWVDPCGLTDFYIDPNTRGPNVQEAEFCIRRKLMTVEELGKYRGQEGWNIPEDRVLLNLAKKKQWTQGDTTRQVMAAARGEATEPLDDQSVDPRLAKVEVFRYFSRDHHVWLLGREVVAWNGKNQYGALPFTNWTYVDVPGAFYGLSIPDLCEGDQSLARLLIEGRIDELNLILHPPFVSKRGTFRTQSQSKLRPGANWEADDPQKDIQRIEMGNVTQQAFVEVDSLENRVQKKTGVTDLAVLGTPSSGGNSANRTATGVQAQTNASNSRVHYLVANYEDQVVAALLQVMWQLTREFMNPQQVFAIVGQAGQQLMVDPVDLLNADPRFVMKTAQRMKQRASLQGGGLQQISQFVLNPVLGSLMEEQQGKVIDVEAYSELFCDVYGVRAFTLFRPMTPQEQQASQQRKQQMGQEKMQLQTARLQQMSQDAHERDETAILIALLQQLGQAGMLNEALGTPSEIGLRAKELAAKIEGGHFEAQPSGQ